MKLKSVLKSLDMDALEGIQQFWGINLPVIRSASTDTAESAETVHDQWVEHLYPRLQNASHFKVAMGKIDKSQRDLLSFLTIHGGNMEEKELRKRFFDGDRTQMQKVVEEMLRHSFLFMERWSSLPSKPCVYGVPEPFLRLIELPHFWKDYLGDFLRNTSVDHLHAIVSSGLALKISSNRRDHLIFEARSTLTDPEKLRKYVDALPNSQREILFLLLQRRGVCLYCDLLDLAHKRLPHINRNEAIEGLLASSGLLFQATENPTKFENLLRIPRDIYYIITHHFVRDTRGLDKLDSIGKVDLAQQPSTIQDNGISISRDIVIFVGYIQRHPVRRLGNGGIGRNDLKKILTRLSNHKTLKYTQFLSWFCIKKRFLVPKGEYWGISETFNNHLDDSRAFYLDIYTTWLGSNDWNEEFIDGDCVHNDHPPTNLINIIELRNLTIENLAKIPFDTWIDGPRFIESLLAQIEVRIPHRGEKRHLDKYNRINYLAIESLLCETLYWMGLLALGLHENTRFEELGNRHQAEATCGNNGSPGGARLDQHFNFNPRPFLPESFYFHFQINGLGRSLFRADSNFADKITATSNGLTLPFRDDMVQFTVLPNLDVISPPDLNLRVFSKLRQFTEIRNIDVMSLMAITHNSVRAGMEHGLKGEEIILFLEMGCQNHLPETVRHLVSECSNRYGELVLGYAGGYILVDDPVLREDLRNSKSLNPWVKDIKGDRVLVLNRSADVQHVAQELKTMGFMPSVDSENVYSSENRLRFSLEPKDLGALMAVLRLVTCVEKEMGVPLTEEMTLPLLNTLRPSTHTQLNIDHYTDVLSKRFEKTFEGALKKKINAVANKYRRQMRDMLAQKNAPRRPSSLDVNAEPATTLREIRKLLRQAIEQEVQVKICYKRNTGEEIDEVVQPESLNGDKLFAFCEKQQSYCAYRMKRIVSVHIQ